MPMNRQHFENYHMHLNILIFNIYILKLFKNRSLYYMDKKVIKWEMSLKNSRILKYFIYSFLKSDIR